MVAPAGRGGGRDRSRAGREHLEERKRAHVEGVLHEADPGRLATARDDGLHQPAPHAALVFGIDADRPDAGDRVSLVEEVGADDTSVDLGHHAPDRRVVGQGPEHSGGHLQRRKVAREAVLVMKGAQGLKADPRAGLGVTSLDLSQRHHRTRGRAYGLSHSFHPDSPRWNATVPRQRPDFIEEISYSGSFDALMWMVERRGTHAPRAV
jgi:hypothetical protein